MIGWYWTNFSGCVFRFAIFATVSPLKRTWSVIWLKLIELFWRSFFECYKRHLDISISSPLGKEYDPIFEEISLPFPQGWFVSCLIEILKWNRYICLPLRYNILVEKGIVKVNKLEFPLTKDNFHIGCLKMGYWFFMKRKNVKSANNDNGTTNIFLSETLMWGFGSDELKWQHFGLIFDNDWFVIWFVLENQSGERTRKRHCLQ